MPSSSTIQLTVTDESSVGIANFIASLVLTANEDPTQSFRVLDVTSDRTGILSFDLSGETVPLKYTYTVSVTADSQELDGITWLSLSYRGYIRRLVDDGMGGFNPVDLGSTILTARSGTVTISTARESVESAYGAYLTAKQSYEELLATADTIELTQLETYEPATPTYIVTRLLEFQVGTLAAAIRYASDADLPDQLALLQRIDRSITQYTSYYPAITINDGEGIPYSV
jgi:hypothetical protein